MTALRRVEPSRSHLVFLRDRMSPMEQWLFGLRDLPGEADAHPKHPPLHDLATTGAAGIRRVHALSHVRRVTAGDQGIGLRLVHQDQGQAETFEPVEQERRQAPCDAASVCPVGGFQFCDVSVREAEAVVEGLLADAERKPAPSKEGNETALAFDPNRFHCHPTPRQKDAPHDA